MLFFKNIFLFLFYKSKELEDTKAELNTIKVKLEGILREMENGAQPPHKLNKKKMREKTGQHLQQPARVAPLQGGSMVPHPGRTRIF